MTSITLQGEESFRSLEEAVLEQLQSMVRCVICTVDPISLKTPMNWIRMQQGFVLFFQG